MTEDRKEGNFEDDGTEGANVGFMRYGEAEENSSKAKEEPEDELDQGEEDEEDLEEEEESEEEEEESGDEEDEEDESVLPKVSKELQAERDALLRAFTKKTQGISNIRLQAKLVEAIDRDPERVLKDLARRYNVVLGEEAPKEKKKFVPKEVEKLTPKEGEELPSFIQRAIAANFEGVSDMIKDAVEGAMGSQKPSDEVPNEVSGMDETAVQGVLADLNANHPDWGLYEEKMVDIVTTHPSYMNDIEGLYAAAKAQSVNVRDKVKAKKGKKKKVERSGQRGSAVKVTSSKGKKMTFDEGWARAKRDLRKTGR